MIYRIEHIEEMVRRAVLEVFRGMLSMDLDAGSPPTIKPDPDGQIAGSVGFIGEVNGVIYLYAGVTFAKLLTSRMLGLDGPEAVADEMVNDAMGELSNMVGGYVKSRLCDAGWSCVLTIPSIVRGQQLTIDGVPPVTRRVISLRHEENSLLAELLIKQPAI